MKRRLNYILVLVVLFAAASCKKETQPAEENENELITTIQLDFTNRGTADKLIYVWEDADGPGGEIPAIDEIALEPNTEYDVKVTLWDKSKTPAEDVTEEVRAESENHRFYYETSAGSGIAIADFDNDINGVPLGITSVWTTTSAATGTFSLILRHYQNGGKEASDAAGSTKSTTDAGAIFDFVVE